MVVLETFIIFLCMRLPRKLPRKPQAMDNAAMMKRLCSYWHHQRNLWGVDYYYFFFFLACVVLLGFRNVNSVLSEELWRVHVLCCVCVKHFPPSLSGHFVSIYIMFDVCVYYYYHMLLSGVQRWPCVFCDNFYMCAWTVCVCAFVYYI